MSYESLDESLLSAYLDGELSASEAEYVEQALESSASLRQLLEELRLVRRLVVDAVLHASSMDAEGAALTASSDPAFPDRAHTEPDRKAEPSSAAAFGSTAPWLVDRRHPFSQASSAAAEEKSFSASVGDTALSKVELPSASWWTVRNFAMAVSALAASWLVGLLVFSGREMTRMPMASQSGSQKSAREAAPPAEARPSETGTEPSENGFGIREESAVSQSSTAGEGIPENTFEAEHRGLQEGGFDRREKRSSVKPSPQPQDLRFGNPAAPLGVDPAARGAVATDAPSTAALAKASPSLGGSPGGGSPSMPPNPKLLAEHENRVPKESLLAISDDDHVASKPSDVGDATLGNSVDLKMSTGAPATYWYKSLSEVKELAIQENGTSKNEFSNNENVLAELSQVTSREYAQERFFEDVRERLSQVEASLAQSLSRARVDVAERDVKAGPPSESDGNANATPTSQAVPRVLFFGFQPSDNPRAKQGSWGTARVFPSQNSATSLAANTATRYQMATPVAGAPPASGDAPTGTGTPEIELGFVVTEPSTAMAATTGGAWLLFTFRESDSEPALQALRQLGVQWEGMESNRDPLVLLQAKRALATFADVQLGHESLPTETERLARDSWDASNLPALNSVVNDDAAGFGAQVPIDLSAKEIDPAAGKVEPSEPVRMRVVAIYLLPASKPKSNPE